MPNGPAANASKRLHTGPEGAPSILMWNGHNPPEWLHTLAWISLVLVIASALLIAADILAGRKQKMAIMNLVWPIVALSFGPLAVISYWTFG